MGGINLKLMMKKIFVVFFFLSITAFGGMTLLKDQTVFSEMENRNLDVRPDLTYTSFFNGEYSEDFDSFFKDQFYKRQGVTKAYYQFELGLGKPEVNNVSIGKNNWINLSPSKNKWVYDQQHSFLMNRFDFINEITKRNDVDSYFFLLPDKQYVLSHLFLGQSTDRFKKNFLDGLAIEGSKKLKTYNLKENFIKEFTNEELQQFYYKTDHHWTYKGAYQGYVNMINILRENYPEIAEPLLEDELSKYCASPESAFIGSQNRFMMNIIDASEEPKCAYEIKDLNYYSDFSYSPYSGGISDDRFSLVRRGINEKRVSYASLTTDDYAYVVFENSASISDLNVVFTVDSYSNASQTYIPYHFKNTHFLDFRYFEFDFEEYIKDNEIDIVIMMHNSNGLAGEVLNFSKNSK